MEAGARSADTLRLGRLLATLPGLDFGDLRTVWPRQLRSAPPDHLPRYIFVRLLAYRIQAKALGDLDRDTIRYLDRIAAGREKELRAGMKRKPKSVPPVAPVPPVKGLKPGTLLIREHAGQHHTVTVVVGGFEWQGETYRSLSEIARRITGTNWNGPRFFGLRDKAEGRAA